MLACGLRPKTASSVVRTVSTTFRKVALRTSLHEVFRTRCSRQTSSLWPSHWQPWIKLLSIVKHLKQPLRDQLQLVDVSDVAAARLSTYARQSINPHWFSVRHSLQLLPLWLHSRVTTLAVVVVAVINTVPVEVTIVKLLVWPGVRLI